jgi:threonine dehydrogenase-like Zn-dependent dehydrogenase
VIDPHAYRLNMAKKIAGAITIDITEVTDVVKRVAEIIPNGPDAVIGTQRYS